MYFSALVLKYLVLLLISGSPIEGGKINEPVCHSEHSLHHSEECVYFIGRRQLRAELRHVKSS